jgi:hypothetical protein
MIRALVEFGYDLSDLTPQEFQKNKKNKKGALILWTSFKEPLVLSNRS